MKTSRVLPDATAARLKSAWELRREFEPALLAMVLALRTAGWTLQEIADPLGVTRESVRLWQKKAREMIEAGSTLPTVTVEAPQNYVTKEEIYSQEVEMRRMARDARERKVLKANLPRLMELQADAQSLRGPSRHDPVKSEASREYTRLMNDTLAEGVRAWVLADALGIKEITVWARLRRAGYRKMAPSENRPAWADHVYEASA